MVEVEYLGTTNGRSNRASVIGLQNAIDDTKVEIIGVDASTSAGLTKPKYQYILERKSNEIVTHTHNVSRFVYEVRWRWADL